MNNKYYFSSPNGFNDPFDSWCKIIADGTDDEFLKLFEKHGSQNGHKMLEQYRSANYITKNKLLKETLRISLETVGVFCLTELNDNLLMYSHYADSHKGMCLQFTFDEEHSKKLRKVVYSHDSTLVKINVFKREYTEHVIMNKSNIWEYEREWRFIHLFKKGTTDRFFSFPPGFLTGIIFGCKTPSKDEEMLRSVMKSRAVKFYKAVQSDEFYGVDIMST